jgi:4-amino-4-deoxy-L-arabinose transferase-like glycosyltransferase
MAKSSAAAIASLSCVIVYLTAKELFSKTTALATVFIYAFGTSTWSVSSQTLWQHGTTELLLISLLYLIIQNERRPSRNLIVGIGLLSGLFVFNRPPDVFLLLPVIGYIVWYERKKLPVFAISTAVTGLPFLAYNLLTFGNVFGGYGYGGLTKLYAFSPSFVVAFAGSLVSPKVGLLVFCPVLILSVFGYLNLKSVREDRIRQVLVLFGPAIFLLVLEYSFFVQWESAVVWSYGQRYLTGCIPILAIYTGFFLDDIIRRDQHDSWMRAIQTGIILLVMISVGIQAIGVFLSPFHPDRSSLSEETWDWGNSIVLKSYTYGISNVSSVTMYNFPPLPPVFEYKFPRAAAGNANNTYPG